jgi:hypothetical protein
MRFLLLILAAVAVLSACHDQPGRTVTLTAGKEPAKMPPADTSQSNDEKNYWLVILKKGPHTGQDSMEVDRIKKMHLLMMQKLAKSGKIVLAGPVEGDTVWRGVYVLDCRDSGEVAGLLNTDAAVVSGRVRYEIHPWLVEKGSYQFK